MTKEYKPSTEKAYWESIHENKAKYIAKEFVGFRNLCEKQIFEKIKNYFSGGSILELGGGSSDWLISVTKYLEPTESVGLDYSELGCSMLEQKSKQAGISVATICADIFKPPHSTINRFDFVMSFGVVEHFEELPEVMKASAIFCKSGGILYTLIPNMSGINGVLTKFWNRPIYDLHVPHDKESFLKGHDISGLEVLWCDYLGSTNFGVLSSCFPRQRGMQYFLYKQLTRISKIIWFLESIFGYLPATRLLSPYIVSICRINDLKSNTCE